MKPRKAPTMTLEALARHTGSTFRTVRSRLEQAGVEPAERAGRSRLYPSRQALRAILTAERDNGTKRGDGADRCDEETADLVERIAAALAFEITRPLIGALAVSPRFNLSVEQLAAIVVAVESFMLIRAGMSVGRRKPRAAGFLASLASREGIGGVERLVREHVARCGPA